MEGYGSETLDLKVVYLNIFCDCKSTIVIIYYNILLYSILTYSELIE